MAKAFTSLKDPKLQLTDKLTFGKFKDCRICDIIQDHYEYLIWAEKEGFVKFSKEVTDVILEQAHFERWEAPQEEEPDTVKDLVQIYSTFKDEDVPF